MVVSSGLPIRLPKVIGRQAIGAGDMDRMDEHESAKFFGGGPERLEVRIVEVFAHDVGADHGAAQTKLGHRARQFVGGAFRVLYRQRRDAHESLRIVGNVLGDLVVLDGGGRRAQRGLLIVEIGLRRRRQHLHVDAARIHVAQAMRDVEAAGRERPVGIAADIQGRSSRIDRRDGHRDLGRGLAQERGGLLRQDVAVDIDRSRCTHFVT